MLTTGAGRLYFALQAVAGAAWWVAVFAVPPVRRATLGGLDPVLVAALDLPLFVGASALAATGLRVAVWIAAPWTALVACGMAVYATVTERAGWGAVLMVAAAIGGAGAALLVLTGRIPSERLLAGPLAFRQARPATAGRNVGRTGAQIVGFWGLFLGAIPLVIAALEQRWGLQLDPPAAVPVAGAVLLVPASALGIWAALAMSLRGEGTPLPSAAARRLVVSGPYRYVRNPMAVAGIAQGVAVGLLLGSWLVVLYALSGSLLWNRVVRPLEEADLQARFGAAFAVYRERVACWIPRLRPWAEEETPVRRAAGARDRAPRRSRTPERGS
ncbi:isoprenylcysteine carboxylmethyltransferase family protein [Leucobacter sp. wl10]|uniref:methyltransferase family protein n=1 Tax=Leucobacter sp. wl10 TaxID=2304677 RepID=UPI000E5B54EC|nr:isoprenylcysteine carboxylmethyltransferase family protein [Leucobacter sp. wl10]RGE22009.1 isoprenylcysteine carboxylmethyltransferase family protein [Leucobacter sp. wl10]